ncbi:MAG: hypothetical protein A2043_02815 [Candidatus Schekmanbacteria bacterium GWA2_38_9]|uniref:Glycosyltransferase RgtA/B/C/D-like domain-containing protein n=1 Tax=Candidatus Schekmanbacteria bacterium RIFCSPLOWO2_12_FULL_38_15 TaxID=1817883 RepID=A0A1F7SNR1_9BACT|nr:MAG: hypothetical protein A2043_02815 [Candidatus Schekmanbacteria bacterium GWA2_38_9]OGL50264.1 MAG: hypothetical protein A3H37_00735 [Candidatus Schekmanbacteria bacterium RIFCSPLOWO2_02_FULL_38_14]OGL55425.1 MAG: hypothetical protein A3G31_01265 [Candidatus Schekmanbacteria bacterium RIFCSPLOWO2_12_FULL_38_15]
MRNNPPKFLLPSILVLAALLRIYRLGLYDLWFDEVLCAFQREDLRNILNGKILDSNPPLYFLILHFLTPLKASEFILRLPSVIFGVGTIFVLYKFTKNIFDEKASLISSLLLAISPFHIYYSQEVKMYSLFILLSFLSISFFILSITENKNSWWAGFVVSTVLSLYTHYYAMLLILIETITFIIFLIFKVFKESSAKVPDLSLRGAKRQSNLNVSNGERDCHAHSASSWARNDHEKNRVFQKSITKKWLISNIFILLLFSPWIPIMLNEHFFKTSGFVTTWIPKPDLKTFFYTFKNFSVGFSSPRWNYLPAVIIFAFCFIAGLFKLYKKKDIFILTASIFFLPVAILFLVSQYAPVYLDRYISFLIPLFCLIISIGISRFKTSLIVFLLVIISFFSYFGYINLYEKIPYLHQAPGEHERIPIKPVVNFIEENFQPGDIIGHSCRSTLLSFEYYSGKRQRFLAVRNFENYPQSSAWTHSSLVPELVPNAIKDAKRIWLILSWWDPLSNLDPISQELKGCMDKNYRQVSYKKFKEIDLYLYENSPK